MYDADYRRNYYHKNRAKILEQSRCYYASHKQHLKKVRAKYYKAHKETLLRGINEYQNNRKKIDINYKIKLYLRTRLCNALKHNFKSGSAVKDLGCSIEFLRKYLAKKFKRGMSWKNYGKWHIDHIKPLSSFNLTKRKQLLKACNYKNLQPLWAKDNLIKGDSFER